MFKTVFNIYAWYTILVRELYTEGIDKKTKTPWLGPLTFLINVHFFLLAAESFIPQLNIGILSFWDDGSGIKSVLAPAFGFFVVMLLYGLEKLFRRFISRNERYEILRARMKNKKPRSWSFSYILMSIVSLFVSMIILMTQN